MEYLQAMNTDRLYSNHHGARLLAEQTQTTNVLLVIYLYKIDENMHTVIHR